MSDMMQTTDCGYCRPGMGESNSSRKLERPIRHLQPAIRVHDVLVIEPLDAIGKVLEVKVDGPKSVGETILILVEVGGFKGVHDLIDDDEGDFRTIAFEPVDAREAAVQVTG